MDFIVAESDDEAAIEAAKQRRLEFFAAIGYAITRWAHVDAGLFAFFTYALRLKRHQSASVFYKSKEIGHHIALADSALQHCLSTRNRKTWAGIKKALDDIVHIRNHLAHETPMQVISNTLRVGARASEQPPAEHFWIVATNENKMLNKSGPARRTRIDEIVKHTEEVIALLREMRRFYDVLPKRPKVRAAKSPQLNQKNSPRSTRSRNSARKA